MMYRKQITLRFPKELYQQLQKEAERMGISVNALISIILNDYL
ncbi:toxin-antitoxin system HicB family antitoxin [Limosilactobacillus mucosae]|nr:toxin-antitoxin system HicB family antitoxin [Limosilactobacillus mucosae]